MVTEFVVALRYLRDRARAGLQFKRSDTWSFVVDLPPAPDGRRRQRKKGGFRTKKEAEAALAALLTDVQKGTVLERSRQTLAAYLDDWLASAAPSLRPTTVQGYESAIRNWIVPRLGGMRLQAVTPQVLQRLYAELSESGRHNGNGGLSPRSVKLAHTVLHLALGRAALWRLIPGNPAALKLDIPRQVRREMTTWTAAEARRFLDATKDDRLSALWVLMLGTGMRRSEALGLRWEAVDFARNRLAVVSALVLVGNKPSMSEPKTPESRRVVHLDGPVLASLRGQRKRQAAEQLSAGPAWRESGLVFTSVLGGMLDPHNVRRTFDAAIAKAALPPIRLHDLRHTFATLALGAGAHPKQVQEMLGHADVSITLDIYAHVTEDMHRDAAERIGRLLFAPG